jgi:hypothetical protein
LNNFGFIIITKVITDKIGNICSNNINLDYS